MDDILKDVGLALAEAVRSNPITALVLLSCVVVLIRVAPSAFREWRLWRVAKLRADDKRLQYQNTIKAKLERRKRGSRKDHSKSG